MSACKHMQFHAQVNVNRLEDSSQFSADVSIKCVECGLPFQFLGLEMGLDLQGARVSVDGLEARLAICPKGTKPNPIQNMMFGVNKIN